VVFGRGNYAREHITARGDRRWSPDGHRYTHTVAQTRDLTIAGYEVYRFGTNELGHDNEDEVRAMLTAFFDSLFRRHRIDPLGRPMHPHTTSRTPGRTRRSPSA
jgi:hypothetical protein